MGMRHTLTGPHHTQTGKAHHIPVLMVCVKHRAHERWPLSRWNLIYIGHPGPCVLLPGPGDSLVGCGTPMVDTIAPKAGLGLGEGETTAYFLVFLCTHDSRVLMAFLWSFTATATLLSVVGVGG